MEHNSYGSLLIHTLISFMLQSIKPYYIYIYKPACSLVNLHNFGYFKPHPQMLVGLNMVNLLVLAKRRDAGWVAGGCWDYYYPLVI